MDMDSELPLQLQQIIANIIMQFALQNTNPKVSAGSWAYALQNTYIYQKPKSMMRQSQAQNRQKLKKGTLIALGLPGQNKGRIISSNPPYPQAYRS